VSAQIPANEAAIPAGEDNRAIKDAASWRRILGTNGSWVFLLDVGLIIFFSILNPVFFSLRNLQNQLLNGSEGLLLALAMTMLLGAGLIDLSVGANLVFSSIVGAIVLVTVAGGHPAILGSAGGTSPVWTNEGLALLAGLVTCVGVGALFGAVNGTLIAYLRINSLIATLGTLSVATGISLLITGGSDIGGLPPVIQDSFGLAKLFDVIPYPAVVAAGATVAMWVVIRFVRFGTHTLAIGSSRIAAERSGLRVQRHLLKLCMLGGALAGLAGFIDIGHFGSTTLNGHTNDPLAAITAAVIGGAALAGGRVSILGTVWGAALGGILLGGLVVINVSSFYQLIVTGLILLLAVGIDQFRNRNREPR
jgi:ribose transport system permease protein